VYFGLNVPFGLKQLTKLEKLAGQSEAHLGWFGYSLGDGGASTLDVWIYCKPSKAAETPQSKTFEFAQKCLGTAFWGAILREEGHVRINVGGDVSPDDKQWFASVFEALRDGAA
jgi:hypothetical protein